MPNVHFADSAIEMHHISYNTLLSPPVLMHGGLLCIAFRLSVCLSVTIPKSLDNHSLEKNSKVIWVKVKGHVGQGQIRVPNKGRWAHDNVKLLHYFIPLIIKQ